jgi:hypothetical protein
LFGRKLETSLRLFGRKLETSLRLFSFAREMRADESDHAVRGGCRDPVVATVISLRAYRAA